MGRRVLREKNHIKFSINKSSISPIFKKGNENSNSAGMSNLWIFANLIRGRVFVGKTLGKEKLSCISMGVSIGTALTDSKLVVSVKIINAYSLLLNIATSENVCAFMNRLTHCSILSQLIIVKDYQQKLKDPSTGRY